MGNQCAPKVSGGEGAVSNRGSGFAAEQKQKQGLLFRQGNADARHVDRKVVKVRSCLEDNCVASEEFPAQVHVVGRRTRPTRYYLSACMYDRTRLARSPLLRPLISVAIRTLRMPATISQVARFAEVNAFTLVRILSADAMAHGGPRDGCWRGHPDIRGGRSAKEGLSTV